MDIFRPERVRRDETKQRFDVDPDLEKISPHLPDEEINLLFPFEKLILKAEEGSSKQIDCTDFTS